MTNPFIHWRRLIAINLAIMVGYVIYKLCRDFLSLPYIHLLVDYHFGFARRALAGAMLGLFMDKIPSWMPFAVGIPAIVATFALYLKLFQQTFGLKRESAPFFVFLAGSPFFFKNFILTTGFFDILGCAFAIVTLLIPARSFAFVMIAAAGATALVLIHHGHSLLYVPTILLIVVTRYYALRPFSRSEIAAGFVAFAAPVSAGLLSLFAGDVATSRETFVGYLTDRSLSEDKSWLEFAYVWYNPFIDDVHDNFTQMPHNLAFMPVYAVLVLLHAPLISYYRDAIAAIAVPAQRQLILGGLVVIGMAYLVVLVTMSDYARYISNWAVCAMLVLHLVRQLPADRNVADIPLNSWRALSFGFIVTIIPRVGGGTPF